MVMATSDKLKAKRGLGWESSKKCLRFASDMNGALRSQILERFGTPELLKYWGRLAMVHPVGECWRLKGKFDAVCIYMCSTWLRHLPFKYVNVQLYSKVALSLLDLFGMLAAYNYELLILLTNILKFTNCPKLNLLPAIAETVVETLCFALGWKVLTCFIAFSELGAWFNTLGKEDTADNPFLSCLFCASMFHFQGSP